LHSIANIIFNRLYGVLDVIFSFGLTQKKQKVKAGNLRRSFTI